MNRETSFVDSYGQLFSIDEGQAGGFEVGINGVRRHFANDRGPNVAYAALLASGWEKSAAAVELRDIISTIEGNAPSSIFDIPRKVAQEVNCAAEEIIDATVIDPDTVAAKALETLNRAWDGSEPYPPAIHNAILALEKHAETLREDAARESLERDALDLCNAFHGQSVTSWSKLSDHAKGKWTQVAQKARELNLGILGE